jgi:flagellar capping protein FliD
VLIDIVKDEQIKMKEQLEEHIKANDDKILDYDKQLEELDFQYKIKHSVYWKQVQELESQLKMITQRLVFLLLVVCNVKSCRI